MVSCSLLKLLKPNFMQDDKSYAAHLFNLRRHWACAAQMHFTQTDQRLAEISCVIFTIDHLILEHEAASNQQIAVNDEVFGIGNVAFDKALEDNN